MKPRPLSNIATIVLLSLLSFLVTNCYSQSFKRTVPSNHVLAQETNISHLDSIAKNLLIIKAEGLGGTDRTSISFSPHATSGYDKEVDQLKILLSNLKRPQIFTYADDFLIAHNILPDTNTLDLGVVVSDHGTYTLSIERSIGFDYLILEDLIWERKVNLLKEEYTFEYFTSDGNYPFKLYFSDWAIQPLEESDIEIYYYPENIVINSRKQVHFAEITFYDLAGRIAFKFQEEDFFRIERPIALPTGHYIVQLRSNNLIINKKILVRR